MSNSEQMRVLLADDNRDLVAMLASYLVSNGHLVKCVEEAAEAERVLRTDEFDVVLADIYMPGNEDFQLLIALRDTYPELPVVIMTGHPSVASVVTALRSTAVDYLSKPFSLKELDQAIESARKERARRLSLSKMREFAASFLQDEREAEQLQEAEHRQTLLAKLTSRERDVVEKIREGKRPDEVADCLSISPHTVRSHLKSVYRKLGVNSQVELLSRVRKNAS